VAWQRGSDVSEEPAAPVIRALWLWRQQNSPKRLYTSAVETSHPSRLLSAYRNIIRGTLTLQRTRSAKIFSSVTVTW